MAIGQQAPEQAEQNAINSRLYSRADLVREYADLNLFPPEATAIVRYHDDIVGKRVLELGCGAGRLATYLRPHTEHFVGLDFSPHMVEFCRQNVEGPRFLQGDMRDLTAFADGSFDTVFAVYNLFDAVSHEDRLRVLAEVRRVLAPGGLLIFNSHNRNYAHLGVGPHLRFSRNPFTLARRVVEYFQSRANHRHIKAHQVFEIDYALVNDSAHNFAVLHYYISRASQAKQLAGAGFHLLECLDESGLTLAAGDDDRDCSTVHYVARPLAKQLLDPK